MTIYDAGGEILRLVMLETAVIQKVLAYVTERNLSMCTYGRDGLWSLADDEYRHLLHTKYKEPLPVLCPDMGQKLDELHLTKLLISDEQHNDATRAELQTLVGDKAIITQAVPEYIEVMPLGVSKGEGVLWLLDKMNVNPANVMALGDGENDLEMLQMVGLGVAMGNAHARVKAVADVVVGSNESAGVAEAIEQFVLK